MLTSSKQANPTPIAASNELISQKSLVVNNGSKSIISFLQPKLAIGAPDDIYEKEADDMADKVMYMPTPEAINFFPSATNTVNRKCAECEEEEKLHRKESSSESISDAPPIVLDVLNSSGGKSLNGDIRAFMEPRFNYDFSDVKIHDNDLAAKSAGSINALAYTSGNNVVFNSGQYNTTSDPGKRLLAHELTHVVQQSGHDNNYSLQRDTFENDPVEEAPVAVTPPQIWYMLSVPPSICESGCYCWAAGAASFMRATGLNPLVTYEDLVVRFGGCLDAQGCLLEVNLSGVYEELGIKLTAPPDPFNYDSIKKILKEKGHILLLADYGGGMGHAMVIYGVGIDSDRMPNKDYFSVFDPMTCQYSNRAFTSIHSAYIGTRTKPGPKIDCVLSD